MGFFDVSRQARRRMAIAADLPDDHPALLDQIDTMLATLPDPHLLCAEQRAGSMTAVQGLRNRLDAYLTDLAVAADTGGDSRVLHAGTTGMLVAVATGANPQAGSALVARGRALQDLPQVRAAYTAGRISTAHVSAITAHAARIDRFAAVEAAVVTIAETTEPAELRRVLQVLVEQCRPESLDATAQQLHAKRGLSLSQISNGMFRLDGYLDPIHGARLRDALATLMGRTGRDDTRTPAQRRADALADLLTAAAANHRPGGISGLSVLIDLEDLTDGHGATLEDGSALGTRLYDLLTCTAIIAVILGVHRAGVFVPLALGRGKRGASAAQWTALTARDRGCIRCGRAPRYCHAHHIHHWRHGMSSRPPLRHLHHHHQPRHPRDHPHHTRTTASRVRPATGHSATGWIEGTPAESPQEFERGRAAHADAGLGCL